MLHIVSRNQLVKLARDLGVRPDWHEPGEQGVSAAVHGTSFDNAGFWGRPEYDGSEIEEMWAEITQGGKPVAAVNLATLLGWASRR